MKLRVVSTKPGPQGEDGPGAGVWLGCMMIMAGVQCVCRSTIGWQARRGWAWCRCVRCLCLGGWLKFWEPALGFHEERARQHSSVSDVGVLNFF